ncbi:hypothetical protein MG293_019275 [Ovis ammon polii]|uniref:Uncharacterized protein n=1 Tax=Ovis ammon polii TaxID=230172 RepID=A0AAD4TPK9_OVIAM|nr:hypothetical protein MG293_019275 [Ovis ammon polii]
MPRGKRSVDGSARSAFVMKKAACTNSKENKTLKTTTGIEVIASPPKTSPDTVGPEQGSHGHSRGIHYEEVLMQLTNLPGNSITLWPTFNGFLFDSPEKGSARRWGAKRSTPPAISVLEPV